MNIAGIFPGQGAQSVGMGKEFFDSDSAARDIFALADRTLGFSISKLCFEGPIEQLTLTANVQPAILVTSYVAFKLARIPVGAAAGHSLGEYSALVAAQSLAFEDAIGLVNKRGRYMQEAVPVGEGKMVAVIGPSPEEINFCLSQINAGVAEIANLNCPGQTVVAGDVKGVDAFASAIQAVGGKVIPLNVSAPFHCSLMKPAADALARDIDAITFNAPTFPIYCNVSASAITDGTAARQKLKEQVCASVQWTDSMLNMVNEQKITHAVEFGPAGVLTKLFKRIDPAVKTFAVSDTASLAKARDTLFQ